MMKNLLKSLCGVLITMISLTATAQKLPEVQEGGQLAPADIKVDGKNLEWKDVFLANNKRTHILYTVSNDTKNLYLVIKAEDVKANSKILAGGITFSINPDGKKDENESMSLSYPVRAGNPSITTNTVTRTAGVSMGSGGSYTVVSGGAAAGAPTRSPREIDSTRAVSQRNQLGRAKEIKISGFKTTSDTLISIYNEYSIKAFASILPDNKFFYEVAIPLEALGLSAEFAKEIAYNIKLKGMEIPGFAGIMGSVTITSTGGGPGGSTDFQDLMNPTDFWGKYKLVKK